MNGNDEATLAGLRVFYRRSYLIQMDNELATDLFALIAWST